MQHQARRSRGRALSEGTPPFSDHAHQTHRPPPRRGPAPTEAPPRPGPGGGGGAGSGGGSGAWIRRGERVVFPGRAAVVAALFYFVLLSPLCLRPPSFPAPRGRTIPKRSRRRVPQFPERLVPGSVLRGTQRRYRDPASAAPGDLRGRFVASGPGGRRKSRPRGVTVPLGHRRGFPLSSGGREFGVLGVFWSALCDPRPRVLCDPMGTLCSSEPQMLCGPLGSFVTRALGSFGSFCHKHFGNPFSTDALGCFTTLGRECCGVFWGPLDWGPLWPRMLGGPLGPFCQEHFVVFGVPLPQMLWDPQRCCCAPAEQRWLQWELHPGVLELWGERCLKPEHGLGGDAKRAVL